VEAKHQQRRVMARWPDYELIAIDEVGWAGRFGGFRGKRRPRAITCCFFSSLKTLLTST
jgi:hypothetical protein